MSERDRRLPFDDFAILRRAIDGGGHDRYTVEARKERRSVAQPGSALALGARGRRFESGRSDHRSWLIIPVPIAQPDRATAF